jgi:hypothetical protein
MPWRMVLESNELAVVSMLLLPLSFRGASEARKPGIHNHDREYGFRACAASRQLPTKGASRNDDIF